MSNNLNRQTTQVARIDSFQPTNERKNLNIPPSANISEISVIGGMLLGSNAVSVVMPILTKESFYDPRHSSIYEVIGLLYQDSKAVDIITLAEELRRLDKLDQAGGFDYLMEINSQVPTSANIESHAYIIQEKFLKRELIRISSEIITSAYQDSETAMHEIDKAESQIFKLAELKFSKGYSEIGKSVMKAFENISALRSKGDQGLAGVPSGLRRLDHLLGGFQNSDLIILAARPSMGKTALALNFARNAAVNFNFPVAFFSLEMSELQLVLRLLSAETGIDQEKLRSGALNNTEMATLHQGVERLKNCKFFIDDTPMLSILEMRAKCRRLKAEHDVKLIIVDYLQLLHSPSAESREREISIISSSLKQIAKELNIPIVALAQLNRGVEARGDKRPLLSDLRESGSIEQDADVVMFVHRDEYYRTTIKNDEKATDSKQDFQKDNAENNDAYILVRKHRNGRVDDVKVSFLKHLGKFVDYDDNEIPVEVRNNSNRYGAQPNDVSF